MEVLDIAGGDEVLRKSGVARLLSRLKIAVSRLKTAAFLLVI
jgi:hypothetical protein